MRKFKIFLHSRKGAELVEIILGVVIAVALLAVAITYISKTISEKTGSSLDINGKGGTPSSQSLVEDSTPTYSLDIVFENLD